MLFGLFLYIAWAVELSGVTQSTQGLFWPSWLHLALVFVVWQRAGVGAVMWGAVIGLLLDLQSGQAGMQLLLVSTLTLAATDWRESNNCRAGATLALLGTIVVASSVLAGHFWCGMSTGQWPPAAQLAALSLGPATSAVLTALVIRWSFQLSRQMVRSAIVPGTET